MFLIGIAISLLGVITVMFLCNLPAAAALNPSAIAMQLFALAAVLTATKSFGVFFGGLQAAVSPKKIISEEVRGRAASLFRLLSKTAALASLMGLIIGAMSRLTNMNDLEMLGHGLTASLASPLWGVLLIVAVFEPAVFILKKRQDAERQPKNKD